MVVNQNSQESMATLKPFRFLDLPAELRNRIYELVLPARYLIGPRSLRAFPDLLRVSRQIRSEARGIWLEDTVFAFINVHDLKPWLEGIGAKNRREIKTVRFDVCYGDLKGAQFGCEGFQRAMAGFLVPGVVQFMYMDEEGKVLFTRVGKD